MSNWNIEKYLEAIIAGIASGEKTDVPVPSWNIEKYLAAILGAVDSQNPPMDGVVVSGETVYPPNVLNLYDPDDPHGDTSYMPSYATYNGGEITLSDDFDASPYYDRLKRGMPVWARMPTEYNDTIIPEHMLIFEWYTTDDGVGLAMITKDYYIYTENYTPEDGE